VNAEATTPLRQYLVIRDWHPQTNANRRASPWTTRDRKQTDEETVWAAAKFAGWQFVAGRVRLTIQLVYPQRYPTDRDNRYARVKGVVDGLHNRKHRERVGKLTVEVDRLGFFTDDTDAWCDLIVPEPIVERGVKETRITLEPLN
jgi:hypothetical protein